ncbi:hypothetical protein J40TS1_36570 [Paenibacillus montaniterrae]|uniref:SAM-dependent methyltransferase n=1 Tax=Paenibacillus montaniterrae TaxID=429341 RepID=A0A919YQW9_9BACL|nr:SAM-dependent methyltransferase [Paenibacillus montaniterrae]GIP18015.1 hypothetical protein J40TS1_36570 [Paenibacillus montaniterrae]
MEKLQMQMLQFRDSFAHAAVLYDGTSRYMMELENTIDCFSAFITNEDYQRDWLALSQQELAMLNPLVMELRASSARCVAIMEKYRALKLLEKGDNKNDYFFNIEASIEKEFGSFQITPDSKVVLVGSGAFPMTPLLIAKRTGAAVTGIDIDEEAVSLGEKIVKLLGADLPIQLKHTELEQLDWIGETTHIIFSSTVSLKYHLLDWLFDAANPEVVVAMRYGDGLKSLFNFPMEEVDSRKWKLVEAAIRPTHIFDVALYSKALAPVMQGGDRI